MKNECLSCGHEKRFHDSQYGCTLIRNDLKCPCNLTHFPEDAQSVCEHSTPTNTNERCCLVNVGEICNIANCSGYSPVGTPQCVHAIHKERVVTRHDIVRDTAVLEYHDFCKEHGISKATFEYDDGQAAEYERISDTEFQLGVVGDCATNYTVS
jgi:hypothetical protein